MIGDERRPIRVELPSRQVVWVRVASDVLPGTGSDSTRSGEKPGTGLAQDTGIGLRKRPQKEDSDTAEKETRRLIGFAEAIGGVAESVQASLKKARPDTVEVEFGLDIDVATGQVVSLITEAHATASMKVKLGWDLAARAEAVRAGLISKDPDDIVVDLDEESDTEPSEFPAIETPAGPETPEAAAGPEGGDVD